MTNRNVFTTKDFHGNDIENVLSVQITSDAIQADQAVRKSQSEAIAENEVDGRIIASSSQASSDKVYSSQYSQTALDAKQPTMSVHPDSTQYISIENGYQIKVKDLLVLDYFVENTAATLSAFIASVTYNNDGTITTSTNEVLDNGTIIVLDKATVPQEKSFLYGGTNHGNSDDYAAIGTELNASVIRSYFSAHGTGISYDAVTGIYSLNLGNANGELGAHSVPLDPALFSIITGATVKEALLQLEAEIQQVDTNGANGTTTVNTRIDNLVGVNGSNLGTFSGNLFADNLSVKVILQASETAHEAATVDRAAVRSEFAAADSTLQSNITSEETARIAADNALTQSLSAETLARTSADTVLTNSVSAEETARIAGDSALSGRLDIVEGSGAGSVAKAEADSKAYTDTQVSAETAARVAADAALDAKIDNLSQGDIKYIGLLLSDGSLSLPASVIAGGDTRNGADLKDVALAPGETFVVDTAMTLIFNDNSTLTLQAQDKMLCTQSVAATSAKDSDFNVVQNTDSALTDVNIDGLRIEKTAQGKLDITADSIGRVQLDSAIEADIDDARSLTQANVVTSDGDTHFVSSNSLAAQQNRYSKRTQSSTSALTGTFRTELLEAHVNTNGSGNPFLLSAAQAMTSATHYHGNCQDGTVLLAGGNFEANAKAGTFTQATGIYALSPKPQNGINVGITALANGAAFSNIGVFGLAGTAAGGRDRGGVFAVATGSIEQYSADRQANPIVESDAALVADALFGPSGCKALVAIGDSKFRGGKVEVADAPSTDEGVVRLGDIKDTEKCFVTTLTNGQSKDMPCSFDLDKCIIQAIHSSSTVELSITRDNANSKLVVLATGAPAGGLLVRILVKELQCDVTTIA